MGRVWDVGRAWDVGRVWDVRKREKRNELPIHKYTKVCEGEVTMNYRGTSDYSLLN